MNRRLFLRALAGAAAAPLFSAAARKPNILLIVADDLGYGETTPQGPQDIPTPNIESIARNGVRFTNGYVSCPVCSPTRAGLMTGRYQQRFGHEFNPGPAMAAAEDFGLPLDQVTIANRLKSLGYATGMVGKWHLGYRPEYHPLKRGFDEFFGFLGGAHSYIDANADQANRILRGTQPVDEKEYLTDAFAREASAFIERHRSAPFFLYMPFNAVHAPLQAPNPYLERFAAVKEERRRIYSGMQFAMDTAIGKILATLRAHKLEEKTLIFFVSDNGGPTMSTTSRNAPLRGYKGQVLEGGIRVPFLAQWKGHIPAGRTYDQPVIQLDIHPTAVAAAGGAAPAGLDGVNLLPFLSGSNKARPHDRLFWRFGRQAAVRMGDWKLLRQQEGEWELYNLAADIGEKDNLASTNAARAKELLSAYNEWDAQLAQPKWGQVNRQQRRATKRGRKGGKKR
jgi:arylsulfatase A-like enzyme